MKDQLMVVAQNVCGLNNRFYRLRRTDIAGKDEVCLVGIKPYRLRGTFLRGK